MILILLNNFVYIINFNNYICVKILKNYKNVIKNKNVLIKYYI